MANISKEDRIEIIELSQKITHALVHAEKNAKPLMEEIRQIEINLVTHGLETQSFGRVVNMAPVTHLENARIFLKFAKEALQYLAKAAGILFKKDFKGPHFHKMLNLAHKHFGPDHAITNLLKEDQNWLKVINDLRNEDEHPKSGKPFLRGFSVSRSSDGVYTIEVPRFFNDNIVLNILEVYSHNLLTFSEELLSLLLQEHFPDMACLYEIPEEQRNPSYPKRFRVGIKPGSICIPDKDQ